MADFSQVISTADGKLIQAGVERVAIDRHTGMAVDCCGETLDGKPVRHQGYVFKLPFDTPPQDVLLWDSTAAEAYPAAYKGVDEIAGHRVYKFVLNVPAHQIRTQPDSGALVGEAPGYDAPVWNQSTKTLNLFQPPKLPQVKRPQHSPVEKAHSGPSRRREPRSPHDYE